MRSVQKYETIPPPVSPSSGEAERGMKDVPDWSAFVGMAVVMVVVIVGGGGWGDGV